MDASPPVFGLTVFDKVNKLIEKDSVFNKYFPLDLSLGRFNPTPQEEQRAVEVFQEMFPEENFEDFVDNFFRSAENRSNGRPDHCDEEVYEVSSFDSPTHPCKRKGTYDPVKRGYFNVMGPRKKRRKEEFDVFQFIKRKEEERDSYKLSIDQQCGDDGYLDVTFEDKKTNDLLADQSLRKIARIVHILSDTTGYALLSCHSERRIR